jgi:hypothetical protein
MTKNFKIGERLKFRKLGSQLRARLFEELGEVVAHRFEASSELEQARTRLSPATACASGSSEAGRALKPNWRGRRASGVGCGARPPPAGRSSLDLAKREAALRGGRALRLLATVKIASRADDCGNEKTMAKSERAVSRRHTNGTGFGMVFWRLQILRVSRVHQGEGHGRLKFPLIL